MTVIGADAARLAGLQIDQLSKVRAGQLSLDHLERFLNLSPEAREERFGDGKKAKETHGDGKRPQAVHVLALHKTVELGDVAGKKTRACMSDKKVWSYRDSDIDSWLPSDQPTQLAGVIGVYQLQKEGTTFREMAASVLKVALDTPIAELAKLLKERGHTTTAAAVEEMVKRQEAGEDMGLRTDGWANFAFVENADGSVSVLYVDRDVRRWRANVLRLSYVPRWYAENRVLVRNSDTPTL